MVCALAAMSLKYLMTHTQIPVHKQNIMFWMMNKKQLSEIVGYLWY